MSLLFFFLVEFGSELNFYTSDSKSAKRKTLLFSSLHLYIYRLDGALIRPGRVDMKIGIDYATRYQLEQMYQRFYQDEPVDKSIQFATRTLGHGRSVSMAQVQGYFMLFKSDPNAVLEHTDRLWSM